MPAEVKIPLAFVLVALLLFGGYFAAGQLSGAKAADDSSSYVLETTVKKILTVREHGKLVVKRVPVVVHRSVTHSETAYRTVVETHFVTTPGSARASAKPVVKQVVRTVTQVLPVERVVKVTVQQTVTDTQTVTVASTVTVTSPGP